MTDAANGRATPGGSLTIDGQIRFLDTFLPVRDDVIHDFYHPPHKAGPTRNGTIRNLRAATRLLGTGSTETVPDIYQRYYNRLFSTIWLALNWGPYTPEIRKIEDPQLRIYLAQLNSVDTCWEPALRTSPEDGLLVEIGTGLSDGWVRIATLMPHVRIVSITIESDQAEIARRIAGKLGLADRVEIRVGDIFDPATTHDLTGAADAVTAMGVLPHFPPHRKAEGLHGMATMLKPGAPLLIFDAYRTRPFSRFMTWALIKSLCWYPAQADFRAAFDQAGMSLTRFDTHSPETCLPLAADIHTTNRLRQEAGPHAARLFTIIVRKFMKALLEPQESVYLTGVRRPPEKRRSE